MFTKSSNEVQPMTLEAASDYARQLVELEARGPGDTEGAMFRLEQRYGIGTNQLMHLRAGRAKSCDVSLFARLRLAYLDLCAAKVHARQVAGDRPATGRDMALAEAGASHASPLHSFAHVNELGYQAVRRALFPVPVRAIRKDAKAFKLAKAAMFNRLSRAVRPNYADEVRNG